MNKPNINELREIGKWLDLTRYYVDKSGTVWSYQTGGGFSNKGPEKEFRETFSARFRGELYPIT